MSFERVADALGVAARSANYPVFLFGFLFVFVMHRVWSSAPHFFERRLGGWAELSCTGAVIALGGVGQELPSWVYPVAGTASGVCVLLAMVNLVKLSIAESRAVDRANGEADRRPG